MMVPALRRHSKQSKQFTRGHRILFSSLNSIGLSWTRDTSSKIETTKVGVSRRWQDASSLTNSPPATNAVMMLRKKVGWVLTGTPISNGVEGMYIRANSVHRSRPLTETEIFPYLQFIGDPRSQERPGFIAHYLENGETEVCFPLA